MSLLARGRAGWRGSASPPEIRAASVRAVGLVGLALVALAGAAGSARAQQAEPPLTACAGCHRNIGRSREQALQHAPGRPLTCLSCHHVGYASDAATIAARRDRVCAGCHPTVPPTHAGVTSGRPGCTTCHNIHDEGRFPESSPVSRRCVACHTTPHPLHAAVKDGPRCTDCHVTHAKGPPPRDAEASRKCASCHKSAHPSHANRTGFAAACTSCHDVKSRRAAAGPELERVCVSCHRAVPWSHAAVAKGAPRCSDCHAIAADTTLPWAGVSISRRCGACHAQALAGYRKGAHAQGLAAPQTNPDLPTCVTCHSAHDAWASTDVRLAATVRCITCHSNGRLANKYGLVVTVGASYGKDYHGATLEFLSKHPKGAAQPAVLTCSDCHGAHEVRRKPERAVAAVCLSCHKAGDARLAGAWLGHAPAGPHNRPLIWLARLFYYVLIPFMLVGLALNIAFSFIEQKRKGARALETEGMKRLLARLHGHRLPPAESVIRFNLRERLEHLGSMSSFILLALTGVPQTRPDLSLAHGIIQAFGGIHATRVIHRSAGWVFLSLMLLHVIRAIVHALRTRQLPVMVPRRQDFSDLLQTMRHFVRGAPRPKTGKFDFSEKFEYWGLFLGGTLMSATGVGLVFAAALSHLLPGELIATFRVLHGLEATFAVLVVALWHTYGVVLRPEIFPLDTSVFTGRIPLARLKEEHELEHERLYPEAPGTDEEGAETAGPGNAEEGPHDG